jgi:hypothetical protein
MPAKRQPKGKGKALATTLDSITVAIEPDEIAPSPAHTSFDTPPNSASPPPADTPSTTTNTDKGKRISWTNKIVEQLVKVVYAKWEEALGACDNRIKRDIWHIGVVRANGVRRNGAPVT